MSDEDTAQPLIRFTARVVQEFTIEAATVGEAYEELNRLSQRTDDRAILIDGVGQMAPSSYADAERIRP